LKCRLEDASTGHNWKADECSEALTAVREFYGLYEKRDCEKLSDNRELVESFGKLKAAVERIRSQKIVISINDGIISWKNGEITKDLCPDPSITDKNEFIRKSDNMCMNEGLLTVFLESVVEELRIATEGGEKLADGRCIAMLIGGFLYCVDLSNLKHYYAVPVNVAGNALDSLLGSDKRSETKLLGTVAAGVADGLVFSISLEAMSSLKRLAVGGPKVISLRGLRPFKSSIASSFMRVGKRAIPVVGQFYSARDIVGGVKDTNFALGMALEDIKRYVKGVGSSPKTLGFQIAPENIRNIAGFYAKSLGA